jgi:hypothetical protein
VAAFLYGLLAARRKLPPFCQSPPLYVVQQTPHPAVPPDVGLLGKKLLLKLLYGRGNEVRNRKAAGILTRLFCFLHHAILNSSVVIWDGPI